jgi:translation initiation factor 1
MLRKMTPKKKHDGGLVYSTEFGRMCPKCRQPSDACRCRGKTQAASGDGVVRVGWETKGRKGKGVTTINGIALDQDALKKLARQLKQACGTGGTVKKGTIEIQGDHRERLMDLLVQFGWVVKRGGG